jgi:hypothetical protein
MHLENRVGEKLLSLLLSQGAIRYQKDRNCSSLDGYVQAVQNIVRTQILGTRRRPKQWRLPLSKDKKEVTQVKLSNKTTRKVMKKISLLIEYIYDKPEDEETKNTWLSLVGNYNPAMEILRKRSEYTDEEIDSFQEKVDDFYLDLMKIAGIESITNYIHMLGSGHIRYYMEIHRNLYRYSQQGWESLNAKVKDYFFRHSQRGGNYGSHTDESERSYLFSIVKGFQREMLWISGDAEKFFLNLNI